MVFNFNWKCILDTILMKSEASRSVAAGSIGDRKTHTSYCRTNKNSLVHVSQCGQMINGNNYPRLLTGLSDSSGAWD